LDVKKLEQRLTQLKEKLNKEKQSLPNDNYYIKLLGNLVENMKKFIEENR